MSLQTSCPSCNKVFTLPENLFGKRIKCKNCGGVFRVGGGEIAPTSDSFDSLAASAATQPGMEAQPDTGTERKMPGAKKVEGMFPTQIEGMTNVPPAPEAYFGDQTESDLTSSDTHTDTLASGDTVSDAVPGSMALDQTATGMEETTTLPEDASGLAPDSALSSGDTVSDAVPSANAADLPPTMNEAAPDLAAEAALDVPEEVLADEEEGAKKPKLPGKGKLPAKGKLGKKETKSVDKSAPVPGKGKLPVGRKASEAPVGGKKGSKLPILLFVPLLLIIIGAALVLYVPQVREALKLNDNEMVNQIAAKVGAPVTSKKDEVAKQPEPAKEEPKEQPKEQPKPEEPKPEEPKPDEPKPDEPKPDQPKPDKPRESEYNETGYEHLRAGKQGMWAAMETKSKFSGNEMRSINRYIFDRVEGDEAFGNTETWMFMAGMDPMKSESKLGPLALKYKAPEGEQPKPEVEPKIEKGSETLTLAGKEWNCKWVQTTTVQNGKETVYKVWIVKDKISTQAVGMANGGRAEIKVEMKMGDDWMNAELIALGMAEDEFKLPGAAVEQPKPDQPKPDEPKPEDEMVEVTIPGAKWLRDCQPGDWVLVEMRSKFNGTERITFQRMVFDRMEREDAILYPEDCNPGEEPSRGGELKVATLDKKRKVKKQPEGDKPKTESTTGEETISLGDRDFACTWTETVSDQSKSRSWQVKDKSDPRMIGLAGYGWGTVKSHSTFGENESGYAVIAWGTTEDDYKTKLPKPTVEQPKPDEPKPDQPKPDEPKPDDGMVEVRTPSPYKHLANLDPGMWVILEEKHRGHLLDDTTFHLVKFRTLDGDFAVLSVDSVTYATGKEPKRESSELRLNTADDIKKYKKGEEPAPEEKPAQTEETISVAGRDVLCLLAEFTESDEKWKVWTVKTLGNELALAGRGKTLGTGAVKIEINAGEIRYSISVHSHGSSLEEPKVPEPTVEQPKPDEPKPDQPKPDEPKPEDEWVEVTTPGATWLTQCQEGDWVIMKSESKGLGHETVSWIRYVFVKIEGDDAVINMEMHMKDGTSLPGTPMRVRVSDKVERVKKADVKEPPKSTTGEETISLGGRDFVCAWTEMTTEGGYLVKSWTVKDKNDPRMIGLANGGWGIIQMTMHGESSGTDNKSTLVAFGSGSDDHKGHLPKPVVEQPKPDEPKPDQPKPDEPKPDEPKVEQPKPDQPKPDQPKPDEPKPDQPKVEQPKLPEPKVEKPETPTKMPESKWPAYEPKRPAEAKFGKPNDYFNEDFNNPKYDWSWLPAGVRLVKGTPDTPGALEIDANSSLRFGGNVADCEVRLTIWRDMSEADREKTGTDAKGYEVMLRWVDNTNYVSLQIRADGYYRIIKVSGTSATILVGDSKGGYLPIPRWNKDLDYDTVMVTVRKDFVGASFNGYNLSTSNEAGSGTGNVGVRTFNGLKVAVEKLDVNE